MIPRILEKVYHEPWLITVGGYESIHILIQNKLEGIKPEDWIVERMLKVEGGAAVGEPTPPPAPPVPWKIDGDGVGHVHVSGVMGQRLSMLEKICGGVDYLDIQRSTESVLDRGAKAVMYAMDSPGGMVTGCQDLARYIKGLPVPTMAYTDSKCNSAAYWLASACNEIGASESATVGSIGVILPWVDKGKVWEVSGLKYEPFTNIGADLKGAGAGPTLSESQRKYLQESVNFVGEQFQNFVSSNRKVAPVVYRAGSYFGKQAQDAGLLDMVGTYGEARNRLLTRCQKESARGPEPAFQGNSERKRAMTRDELMAQHPELYAELVQDQESAKIAERNRLAALDALAFTDECRAIVNKAKVDGKQPSDIAVEICGILVEANKKLQDQVGVYRGSYPASKVPSIDPAVVDDIDPDKNLSNRLASFFAKRKGVKLNNS